MSNKKYNIKLTKSASKELASLSPYIEEATKAILILEKTPNAGHILHGDLHNFMSLDFSLQGGGQYSAAYIIIETERVCIVFAIGPHEGFYERVKLRAKTIRKRYVK